MHIVIRVNLIYGLNQVIIKSDHQEFSLIFDRTLFNLRFNNEFLTNLLLWTFGFFSNYFSFFQV
jgi:hypothetical protein